MRRKALKIKPPNGVGNAGVRPEHRDGHQGGRRQADQALLEAAQAPPTPGAGADRRDQRAGV